jgi:lambda repressor-like predicted transcriptional regulator
MIKDPVTITVMNSYSLKDWSRAVALSCIKDNPDSTMTEISQRLGINPRTLRSLTKKKNERNNRK